MFGVGESDVIESYRALELGTQNTLGLLGVGLELQQSVEIARCPDRLCNTLRYKEVSVSIRNYNR